jgi:hypothetical protein
MLMVSWRSAAVGVVVLIPIVPAVGLAATSDFDKVTRSCGKQRLQHNDNQEYASLGAGIPADDGTWIGIRSRTGEGGRFGL